MNSGQRRRSGVVILVVLGMTLLMAGLILSLLMKARLDASQSGVVLRVAQARMMLGAACAYVQEGSRIGWRLSGAAWDARYPSIPWAGLGPARQSTSQQECFGWVDVRDGTIGPRTYDYDAQPESATFTSGPFIGQIKADESSPYDRRYSNQLVEDGNGDGLPDRPAWPAIGGVARCPLFVMARPPFAIDPTLTPNPIETEWSDPARRPYFGLPLLRRPDPQPMLGVTPSVAAAMTPAQRWQSFATGDRRARDAGGSYAWFRILRDGPATFVVTCGSGASQGFATWTEVQGAAATARFNGDRALFEDILRDEVRLWYRLEWTPAVEGQMTRTHDTETYSMPIFTRLGDPFYGSEGWSVDDATSWQRQGELRMVNPAAMRVSQGGSIAWIQRLMAPPWAW